MFVYGVRVVVHDRHVVIVLGCVTAVGVVSRYIFARGGGGSRRHC